MVEEIIRGTGLNEMERKRVFCPICATMETMERDMEFIAISEQDESSIDSSVYKQEKSSCGLGGQASEQARTIAGVSCGSLSLCRGEHPRNGDGDNDSHGSLVLDS